MRLIEDKVSILVCSCDAYNDLWPPFFTLYKKYWTLPELPIFLNTETVDFSFEGLHINCVHPKDPKAPYGERMIEALRHIKTEYVITFLDDFFLREPVDGVHIQRVIEWMDKDKKIVCFNQDCLPTVIDWEKDTYPGYKRLPWGTEYTLNMQVAVWRTNKLIGYWMPDVSPWEWEEYCNIIPCWRKKDKFYCLTDYKNGFSNYGFNIKGMGVYHGKWVMQDVQPLFEKENISVDYTRRGTYDPNIAINPLSRPIDHKKMVKKCFGRVKFVNYCLYCLRKKGFHKIRTTQTRMFYHFIDDTKIDSRKKCVKLIKTHCEA